MYEVGVIAQFEAAHRLIGDFGPATRMHGHTYRLEVIVRGERLRDVNTTMEAVADFCWNRLAAALTGEPLLSLLVRVWESPQAYAARDDRLDT